MGLGVPCPTIRDAATAKQLRGTNVWVTTPGRLRPAKGRAGCLVREGVAPSCCEGSGYHPLKIFENSDAKSYILVTTCCKISCFLKSMAKKLGVPIYCWSPNLKVGGPVSPGTTVVAPMPTMAEWPQLMEGSVVIFSEYFAQFTGLTSCYYTHCA